MIAKEPAVALVRDPIDVAALAASVPTAACGAVVSFAGIVRAEDEIVALGYEAYEAMAVPVMREIAAEAQQRFGPLLEIAIVHRVAELAIGEASVAIVVAAPHRAAAFSACAYAIDELKVRVPIWKREVRADGSGDWKPNP